MNRVVGASSTEARDWLFGLTLHGIKLGFDNINHLLAAAGNPQEKLRALHVAGTNGKGSVTAFLDASLRQAGYSVSRFTSPHLLDVSERFLLGGHPIPEAELAENIAFFRDVAATMDPLPTFFELCNAIAFRWFLQNDSQFSVVEVGMGGRLDSTNVLAPLGTVITNIDLDHTAYLGDTLEAIAYEKAGILKPGVPAVVGERHPGPLGVIRARAKEIGCEARILGEDFDYQLKGLPWEQRFSYHGPRLKLDDVPLGLAGRYQGENAALAVALLESLPDTFPLLDEAAIRAGLTAARWPCRLERIACREGVPPVIIDVAHNVAGAQRLAEAAPGCVTVLSCSSDKNGIGMLDALAPVSSHLILTQFQGKRALPLAELSRAAGQHPHDCAPDLREAIARGMALADAKHPLLITGSIYTAGEARQLLMEHYGAEAPAF